ncbi:cation:proton antiporter domain-containing protein [Streptomyces mirabilis]|uniref:cation:proton antiporter domain-containing protein n=1 Tax=Streptomyces mirabilis TaxID=68239 RepID=UPI003327E33B
MLSPDVVLFLFLPALLYWEALTSSVREIRDNSASPYSLLNDDGTALVPPAVAIEVVTDERPFSWSGTALAFVESCVGGIVIGAAIALLLIPVRRRLPELLLHSVLSVATPFLAYLPAELLHVSGVLAVVTCGLVTTRFRPRVIGSDARIQATAFWEVASYLLNSALFILVGIQLPVAVRALTSVSLAQAAIAAVSVAVIGTRLLWFYSVPCLVRFLDRRPQQRDRRITAPQRLPLTWAGMRGAISQAAALTVPAVAI